MIKMINKNTIKHLQDISMPAKQVCLVQVPTLAIARRHDFQISFEFIWYMKSLESVFRFYSILQGSWGRFTNWGKSNCNDFRINTPWLVQYQKGSTKSVSNIWIQPQSTSIWNQPHPKGPSPFPHISPMTPPAAWSRRYDDNSAQFKLAIGVILTNPAPPQLAAVFQSSSQSNFQMVGKMPTFWASKFPAMYHHYTGDILRG